MATQENCPGPVWSDVRYPDSVRRDAAAFSLEAFQIMSVTSHMHRKAQLVHLVSGNLVMKTMDGIWTVPPGRAVWIPPGIEHSTVEVGSAKARCIFLEPHLSPHFLPHCHLIFVHPLLEAILDRLTPDVPGEPLEPGREGRLLAVLLDELAAARGERFHLPLPGDRRLQKIVERVLKQPSLHISVDFWCAEVGMSPRTLSRLFQQDVGMPFSKWRQLLHVQIALRDLECGATVGMVAHDLGYESASAFITMFKRNTGQTPGALQQTAISRPEHS